MTIRPTPAGATPATTTRSPSCTAAGLVLALAALASPSAFADMFCGPGKHLGAENDGAGQSWLCVPDRPAAAAPTAGARRLAPLPGLPVPSLPASGRGSGMAAAAGTLGAFANLLSGIQNLQDALDSTGRGDRNASGGRNRIPGGMPAYTARVHDLIGIQYLTMGMALQDQSLVEAAADSYARAEQSALLAGDDELLGIVRERQGRLSCMNAITFVMNTGRDPKDRADKYQRVKGICQGPLEGILAQLVAHERSRAPAGGDAAGAPLPTQLREALRRLLAAQDRRLPDDDDGPAPAPGTAAAPAGSAARQAAAPPDDNGDDGVGAYPAAKELQRTRQRIWCDRQGADRASCLAADNGGIDYCRKFFGDSAKFDACQHAFHDPNIWYDATKDAFGMDPRETRREIDRLLSGFDERVKGADIRALREIR